MERASALALRPPIPLSRAAHQCGPLPRDRGAFRRGSSVRAPCGTRPELAPAGRRARSLHVFIDVRERRLDPRRTLFAGVFRPRALPRLLQIDVSTSTALDRSNIPGLVPESAACPAGFINRCGACSRTKVRSARPSRPPRHRGCSPRFLNELESGRLLPVDRCLSIGAAAEGARGQGSRITESSALPHGIAPARDFAPTPIASGSSRRGHCASPCLNAARVTGKAAGAAPR